MEQAFATLRELIKARDTNERDTSGEIAEVAVDILEQFITDIHRIADALESMENSMHKAVTGEGTT